MARDAILLLCLEGRQRGGEGGNSVFTGLPLESREGGSEDRGGRKEKYTESRKKNKRIA